MRIFLLITLAFVPRMFFGQTYILESSEITFFSEAPLENIEATTRSARSIFKTDNAEIAFQIPINTFQFRKSLMQQHFNENFMESDKFPYATFSGKIVPFNNKPGKSKVRAIGKLTIHGVTRDVTIDGILEKKGNKISMNAKFPVKVQDYDIKIPRVVFFNIAEVVDVDVAFQFKEHN